MKIDGLSGFLSIVVLLVLLYVAYQMGKRQQFG